jgi:hypothetical protein
LCVKFLPKHISALWHHGSRTDYAYRFSTKWFGPVDWFCLRVTNQFTHIQQQKYSCLKSHKAASPEMWIQKNSSPCICINKLPKQFFITPWCIPCRCTVLHLRMWASWFTLLMRNHRKTKQLDGWGSSSRNGDFKYWWVEIQTNLETNWLYIHVSFNLGYINEKLIDSWQL